METVTLEVGASPRVRFTTVSGDLRLTGREGTTLEAQASERGGLSAKPVGDRIEINQLDTWGDVVHIGARTTRIRTRDNRMVIVRIPRSARARSSITPILIPTTASRLY